MKKLEFNGVEYPLIEIDYVDELQFMEDCYFGEGGFRDGSYLEEYPRETEVGFAFRKKIATFPDVFRSEFDALVEPIYAKEITRETNKAAVKTYLASPRKRLGETINTMMERITKTGLRLGTVFTVTDAPSEQAESSEDDTNVSYTPYTQIVKPQYVEGYKLNEFGGIQILVYKEVNNDVVETTKTPDTMYRVYIEDNEGGFHTYVTKNGTDFELDSYEPLDALPVKMLEFNDRYNEMRIAKPKFYNVARKFLRAYLLTSNVDDGYWKNCFALLVFHGNTSDLEIGNDAVLEAPEDATSPAFIAPPTDHLDKIEATIQSDKEDAQEAMTSASAVASTASAQSRMEVDRRRQEVITGLSGICQAYEMALIDLDVRLFITGSWEYSVAYPTDFDSVTSSDTIMLYTDLANSGMVTSEVKKLLGNKSIEILPNLTEAERKEWIDTNKAGELDDDIIPNLGPTEE